MLLSELLAAVPEAGLTLLNPGVNLERPVSGIDSSETPDISQYIAQDTLLLTTAMVFKSDPEGLIRMVEQLSGVKSAGIAIKLGRFITEVPDELLMAATNLGYPVFSIPADTTLGVTYHKLQSYIWGIETRQIYQGLAIQKAMSNLLSKGASLSALLQCLSRDIKYDVYYFDYFFDLLACSSGEKTSHETNNHADEIGQKLREAHALNPITLIDELRFDTSLGDALCIVTPVEAGDVYPCFLVIINYEQKPDPLLYTVIELASMVLSFRVQNLLRLQESDWKSKAEHLQRLLHIKPNTDPSFIDAYQLASTFPLLDLGSYQIAIAGFSASRLPDYLRKRDHFALIHLWISKQTADLGDRCILIPLRDSGHILLFVREQRNALQSLLKAMAEKLNTYMPLDLRFGIGNQTHKLEALNPSYIEAVAALRKALDNPDLPAVQFYDSEGISELLQFAPEDHIRHYCTHVLQTLAYPEGEYLVSLRETLEVFLNSQCDISQTARVLYVHRNTVRYRITKIQNILMRELEDPEFTLQLRLAIFLSSREG